MSFNREKSFVPMEAPEQPSDSHPSHPLSPHGTRGHGGYCAANDCVKYNNTLSDHECADRSMIAAFMLENGPRIRRRVRGKLGTILRRTVDSEDILSTVIRRLDRFAASGKVRAISEGELWSLITRITDAAIADKLRKKHATGRADTGLLSELGEPAWGGEPDHEQEHPERVFDVLEEIKLHNGSDAEIASLWARGLSHSAIAACLGQETHRVRSRWQLIKRRLRGKRDT